MLMGKSIKDHSGIWVLIILLIIGGLAGSALANLLAPSVPWLKSASTVGLKPPVTIDMQFFNLTFGFTFVMGPLSVLGMILGYVVYRKW